MPDGESVAPLNKVSFEPQQVIVAIPTLNEAAHIEACLASLIGSDPYMTQVQIVVADGGSDDDTVARVRGFAQSAPNVSVMHNPQKLQSAAINAVVARHATAAHQVLVRCDAHAIYPAGYVRAVAESLARHPDAASVATAMDAVGQGGFQQAAAWIVDTPLGSGGSAHRGGRRSGWVDHAHHAGFRLDWFKRIGGYDSSFSHNEDAEYDHRLGLAGGRVWLDATIRMDYVMRPTPRALWRQAWNYGRGRARTVMKHRMKPRLRQVIPVINFVGMIGGAVLAAIWPAALLWLGLYLAALALVSVVAVFQLKHISGLWAGVVLGISHNAWALGFLVQISGLGRFGSHRRTERSP